MPGFGYSPDGIMDKEVLLEVKCLAVGKRLAGDDFAEQLTKKPKILEKTESGSYILRKNTSFYTQIQFGLAVLDFQMGKLLLYYNSTAEGVVVVDVPRDHDFLAELLDPLRKSYFSHILPFLFCNRAQLLLSKDL